MKDSRLYDTYIQTQSDWLWMPSPEISLVVLLLQTVVFGVLVVIYGCHKKLH